MNIRADDTQFTDHICTAKTYIYTIGHIIKVNPSTIATVDDTFCSQNGTETLVIGQLFQGQTNLIGGINIDRFDTPTGKHVISMMMVVFMLVIVAATLLVVVMMVLVLVIVAMALFVVVMMVLVLVIVVMTTHGTGIFCEVLQLVVDGMAMFHSGKYLFTIQFFPRRSDSG